jgi:ribose transport system permease protein
MSVARDHPPLSPALSLDYGGEGATRGRASVSKKELVARFQSLLALAVIVVAMCFLSDRFLTTDNQLNILRQISVNLCLSIGMTLVILTAGIDLSVGALLAVCGAAAAGALKHGFAIQRVDLLIQFNPSGAILIAVLVGAALGYVNGLVITRLGVPPFITTLGMIGVARCLTMVGTGGHPIGQLGPAFEFIGSGTLLKIPVPVWIGGVLTCAFSVVTKKTRFGRYIYAIGGNERAAVLSGLPVGHVKRTVYTLCGALAGVAAVILTARLDSADPKSGVGYELDSIAAVVIGGASISCGRGSSVGTLLGCLIIGVLNNALALLNVRPDWQLGIKGIVIVAAVALDVKTRGRSNE